MNMSKTPGSPIDPQSAKLCEISAEVSRVATTLAQLVSGPEHAAENSAPEGVESSVSIGRIEDALDARRLRYRFFDAHLFADPAWDMLLVLFRAEIAQHRVSLSSLADAAAVPATTAQRWIKAMTDADLFRRRADPTDARRIFLELSPTASGAMRAYFLALRESRSGPG